MHYASELAKRISFTERRVKMRNNKGFTFIEMIVVIALLAIAVGVAGYTAKLVASTRAKTTADALKAALEETQALAMSRGGGTLKLCIDDDGNIWAEKLITNDVTNGSSSTSKQQIGTTAVTIQYHVQDSTDYMLAKNAPVEFSFNPVTGAFTGARFVDKITVSGGGKTIKMTLWKLTGRVELE